MSVSASWNASFTLHSGLFYQSSSIVVLSVCLSAGSLLTSMFCVTKADSIQMPFGLVGRMGPSKRVSDGGGGQILREIGRDSVPYRENAAWALQKNTPAMRPVSKFLWDFLLFYSLDFGPNTS